MKNSDHVKQHSAEALNKHPFLQGFSEQECEIIKACASFVEFEKHSRILQFQAPANCFYLLEYGQVCLFNHISRSSTRPLETLSAPSVLGWSWLMAPYLWHFDAEANTWPLLTRSKILRNLRPLLVSLCLCSLVWGVMVGSYFGLAPPEGSFLSVLQILSIQNFDQMMKISILFGLLHIGLANLQQAC